MLKSVPIILLMLLLSCAIVAAEDSELSVKWTLTKAAVAAENFSNTPKGNQMVTFLIDDAADSDYDTLSLNCSKINDITSGGDFEDWISDNNDGSNGLIKLDKDTAYLKIKSPTGSFSSNVTFKFVSKDDNSDGVCNSADDKCDTDIPSLPKKTIIITAGQVQKSINCWYNKDAEEAELKTKVIDFTYPGSTSVSSTATAPDLIAQLISERENLSKASSQCQVDLSAAQTNAANQKTNYETCLIDKGKEDVMIKDFNLQTVELATTKEQVNSLTAQTASCNNEKTSCTSALADAQTKAKSSSNGYLIGGLVGAVAVWLLTRKHEPKPSELEDFSYPEYAPDQEMNQ